MHPVGLEPATFWSVARCSIQLSYGCISLTGEVLSINLMPLIYTRKQKSQIKIKKKYVFLHRYPIISQKTGIFAIFEREKIGFWKSDFVRFSRQYEWNIIAENKKVPPGHRNPDPGYKKYMLLSQIKSRRDDRTQPGLQEIYVPVTNQVPEGRQNKARGFNPGKNCKQRFKPHRGAGKKCWSSFVVK